MIMINSLSVRNTFAVTCRYCETKFSAVSRQQVYCSEKCRNRHRDNNRRPHRNRKRTYTPRRDRGSFKLVTELMFLDKLLNGCNKCGDTNPNHLTYHHTNPATKVGEVPRLARTASVQIFFSEWEKCILLCANCHLDEHHKNISIDGIVTYQRFNNVIEKIKKIPTTSHYELRKQWLEFQKNFPELFPELNDDDSRYLNEKKAPVPV